MKRFTMLLACLLVVALAVPVVAQDEEDGLTFEWAQVRYRFNHFFQDFGVGETSEKFDDDFDTKFSFTKGEIEAWFEIEIADSTMGSDEAQGDGDYNNALGGYGGKWTPESMADSGFFLQVGDLGTGFGKNVNNDDSPRGSIEVGFDAGSASVVLGYGRNYEGDTNDDAEGDEHLIRGQFNMPLGENGFSIGAYVAVYAFSDVVLQEAVAANTSVETINDDGTVVGNTAVAEVMGDGTLFLGSLAFSGTAGSVDLFAETGFASGTRDEAAGDVAVEADKSGFYALGGADFAVGEMSLGVEAGFGSGDDPDTSEDEGFLGVNNDFGFDQIIEDEIAGDGLSNKIYAKLSIGISPSEKMDVDGNFVYVAPVEEVGGVDTYGFEVNSELNYQLSDNLKYVLMGAFASLEEDWQGESSAFQFMNRLEFNF
ncbi:MAG: hypothetical protein GY801_16095 [bacterium]|nr:hypothetical protein [bacterium]